MFRSGASVADTGAGAFGIWKFRGEDLSLQPQKFWTMRFSGGHIYFGARCVVARAFTLVHVHWFSGFI